MAKEEKIDKHEDFLNIISRMPDQPFGWLEARLPKDVMKILESYIEEAKKNPADFNHKLVGNITKSLIIKDKDDWFFENILIEFIRKFMEFHPYYSRQVDVLSEDAPYFLQKFWVNFQKENEFNPFHNHGGVFSFVIWVKIPTDWQEQHALPISANSNSPKASDFQLYYTTMMGDIADATYLLNKESEGMMLFFPAKMIHSVHPFYNCDKDRISISGNISYDISENSMRQYRNRK